MIVHDSLSDIPYLSGLNGEGIYKTELDNILTIDASKNVVFDDIQSFNEYVRTYLTYRNDVDKGDVNDLDMQLIMALKSNRAMVSRTMEEKNEQHKEIYNLIESLKRDSKYQGIVIMYLVKGRLAQLVERLPYKQVVTGSNPVPPKLFLRFSKSPKIG